MTGKTTVNLLIKGGQVVTAPPGGYPVRGGKRLAELTVIEDGWVACAGDTIAAVGSGEEVRARISTTPATKVIEAAGGHVITPGLIDAHTHLILAAAEK